MQGLIGFLIGVTVCLLIGEIRRIGRGAKAEREYEIRAIKRSPIEEIQDRSNHLRSVK